MDETSQDTTDAQLIKAHVVSLFDAFLARDTATLHRGRTADWKGFQIRSTSLIRGADEYLTELNDVIDQIDVSRYEFLDFDVDVFDDLALVLYCARDYLNPGPDQGLPGTILVRSLDIYRKVDGSWTQIASNICTISDPSPAGA